MRHSLSLVACLLVGCAGGAVPTGGLAPLASRAEPPTAVTLIESVPAETSLGFDEVPDSAETWVAMIDGAEQRLDVAQFYLSPKPDGALEPVLAAVERAAGRGVAVRLLVDAIFAAKYPDALERLARVATIRRWQVGKTLNGPAGGGVQHAKMFVVDDREAYLGSANFDWRALEHIHELGVRIQLPTLARALRDQFDRQWAIAGGAPRLPDRTHWRPVTTGPDEHHLVASPPQALTDPSAHDLPQLVAAIDAARLRISIQLLSYDTRFRDGRDFPTLDRALRRAAARGVGVRLIVSAWKKRHPEALQALTRVPGIEVRFANIPEASTGFIPFARTVHAKYMTIDERWAWVGTSNWDGDYFFHSPNVGLVSIGPTIAPQLGRIFAQVWSSAYAEPVDPDARYQAPRVAE
jgi:phosphatidylserine/phosphatidylglycerophosphate/cardiolipin synthase-like enzyme